MNELKSIESILLNSAVQIGYNQLKISSKVIEEVKEEKVEEKQPMTNCDVAAIHRPMP